MEATRRAHSHVENNKHPRRRRPCEIAFDTSFFPLFPLFPFFLSIKGSNRPSVAREEEEEEEEESFVPFADFPFSPPPFAFTLSSRVSPSNPFSGFTFPERKLARPRSSSLPPSGRKKRVPPSSSYRFEIFPRVRNL